MRPRRDGGQKGFALVSVLLGVSILSLVAVSALSTATVSYHLGENLSRRAQALAVAEAAVDRAILGLTDPRLDQRWRVDGVPYKINLIGTQVTVSIQDELGKVDLNTAGKELLIGVFTGAGLPAEQASTLVDRILDWRDTSSFHRLNGAKADDYRHAGNAYQPRNGPFQSVDELNLVMGMTPELFQRVAPALTVYSGRLSIDPATAPREALLALPGMTPDKIDAILKSRNSDQESSDQEQAEERSSVVRYGVLGADVVLAGRAFTIITEVDDGGAKVSRCMVVRLTGDPKRPYWVLAWR